MAVTILTEDRETEITTGVREDGEHLWLRPGDVEAATGWTPKPEGLCRDDACVPWPADGSWTDEEGRVDVAAFARRMKRPVVHDAPRAIWGLGESAGESTPEEHGGALRAPDFSLPDLDGRMHALADYRGRKIFLYAWGSY